MTHFIGPRCLRKGLSCLFLLAILYPGAGQGAIRTVSNLNDGLAGGTLRAAIRNSMSGDTIIFKRGLRGTILLTNGGPLLIRKDLAIRGPGTDKITISGRNRTRVFTITNANVTISGLTIANGRAVGKNGAGTNAGAMAFGAGVLNLNSAPGYVVVLDACSFVRNNVLGGKGGSVYWGEPGAGGEAYGGAIFNNGTMTINRSTFYANGVTGGQGGGAATGGQPGGNAAGGAICNVGIVALTNCTFAMNRARGGDSGLGGGDLFRPRGGTAEGGAIYNAEQLILVSSTVASNTTVGGESDSVMMDLTGDAYGGGLRNAGEICEVRNTIVAKNVGKQAPDASGTVLSGGFNLVGVTNGSGGFGILFDLVGSVIAPLDPMFSALAGGTTRVFPLLAGSPALDAGSSFGVASDQRGTPRPSDLPAILNVDDGSDIGAFELPGPPATASPL